MAGDRPTLVLLPGLLCTELLWAHQLEHLGDLAEMRVADLTRDDTIAAMAGRVLADAPERFALAGLSMGGYVAFEIMRRAPQRVSRLALLDTRAEPDGPEQTRTRRGLIELAQKGQFKGVTPRLLPQLVHPDRLDDKALCEAVMAMAETVGQTAFVRQQNAIMNRLDSRPTLAAIRCPTLVLCGRQDVLTPPDAHMAMAAGIAEARLEVVENCGHLSPMERPQEVTEALRRWLRRDAED